MILRLSYPNRVGMLARITAAIARARGDLRSVEMVESDGTKMVRDFTLAVGSESLQRAIVQALKRISGVTIVQISNRTLQLHRGGKIEVQNKFPLDNGEVLAMAYTPGVARVCNEIVAHPESVYDYTIKGKTVAIISDGTAVLGLGDIGPEAAMPVMEGKAMLLKALAGLDAYPICLHTKDPQQIIDTVCNISTGFAAINIEDISAPRCFQIEAELQKRLDIPVFHDDQHGAAIVVFAGLVNALKLKRQKLKQVKIVINGAGAAGVAITKFLLSAGAANLIVCDRDGILSRRQSDQLSETHRWVALHTNRQGIAGKLGDALKDADVFIGVSQPHIVNRKMLERMAPKPIVFALANPVPEIMPEEAAGVAYIIATGRSDFPNQINNALVFPAIFRGAINVRRAVHQRSDEAGCSHSHRRVRIICGPCARVRSTAGLSPRRCQESRRCQSKKLRFKLASSGASSHRAGMPESRSGRVWRLAFSRRRWIFWLNRSASALRYSSSDISLCIIQALKHDDADLGSIMEAAKNIEADVFRRIRHDAHHGAHSLFHEKVHQLSDAWHAHFLKGLHSTHVCQHQKARAHKVENATAPSKAASMLRALTWPTYLTRSTLAVSSGSNRKFLLLEGMCFFCHDLTRELAAAHRDGLFDRFLPFRLCSSRSSKRSKPSRMVSGCGGQPGM
jgi:malate dehydrogenase (oxaloacetate-decarboxylating)